MTTALSIGSGMVVAGESGLTSLETFLLRVCGAVLIVSCLLLLIFDIRTGGGVYKIPSITAMHKNAESHDQSNRTLTLRDRGSKQYFHETVTQSETGQSTEENRTDISVDIEDHKKIEMSSGCHLFKSQSFFMGRTFGSSYNISEVEKLILLFEDDLKLARNCLRESQRSSLYLNNVTESNN